MEIINLTSWNEFEKIAKQTVYEDRYYDSPRLTIFRGHANAEWHLQTTLERLMAENMQLENYFRLIERMQNKIETFTNQRWNLPTYEEFEKNILNNSTLDDQTYQYMAYLRHYGFPTPFLDWSRSPFVAALFAFKDIAASSEEIAIYMYSLSASHNSPGRIHIHEDPAISEILDLSRYNKRQEFQQGVYTMCLRRESNKILFSNHESGGLGNEGYVHPFVKKFILPVSERINAFRALQMYNVNSFSLFGTEESLLESIYLEKYMFAGLSKWKNEERVREYGDEYKLAPEDYW